jgi:hypothetical protein
MARKLSKSKSGNSFQLTNVRKYIGSIKGRVAQTIARDTVYALKEIGPYWSGTFEESWVVERGFKQIGATTPPPPRLPTPNRHRITPVVIPAYKQPGNPRGLFKSPVQYTIENTTTYREIAMDLVPGRIKPGGRETAPANWYRTFMDGGAFDALVRKAVAKSANYSNWDNQYGAERTTQNF